MGNEGSHEMEYMAFIFVACWLSFRVLPKWKRLSIGN